MRSFFGILVILLFCPAAPAQSSAVPAEALLSADSLLYLRFDGMAAHRQAFAKTVVHELLQEDLGDFLGEMSRLWKKYLLEQVPNAGDENAKKALRLLSDPTALLKYAEENGAALGVEIIGHTPPRWQATLVFPKGAAKKNKPVVLGMLRLMAGLAGQGEIKDIQERGRRIAQIHWDPLIENQAAPKAAEEHNDEAKNDDAKKGADKKRNLAAWWEERGHVILTLGTEPVGHVLDVCDGKRANLTSTPQYRDVAGFSRYETYIRGYVDLSRAVILLGTAKPNEDRKALLQEAFARRVLIRRLGLDGLKTLTMHWGFEGRSQRSTIALNLAEPKSRKGLLRLFVAASDFDLKKLPPLSPDAAQVGVHSIDWQTVYDSGLQFARIAEFKQRLDAGEAYSKAPTDFEALVNKSLGMNLREDLLESLGSTVVISKAMSEGPFVLGYSMAVKVHDGEKLQTALTRLAEPLKKLFADEGTELALQKSVYRGVTIHSLTAKGVPVSPSYAIDNGWLMIGLYPQTVRAFVLRAAGKRSAWQPPEQMQTAVERSLKSGAGDSRLVGITVNDPRRFLERALPLAPLVGQLLGAKGEIDFDASLIPHTKAITEPLFPNVTVCVDDGSAVRWETHASLDLPFTEVLLLLIVTGATDFAF